jgi:hypothetical protein
MGFPWDFLMILYYSTGSDDPVMFQVDYFEGVKELMWEYQDAVDKHKLDGSLPPRLNQVDDMEDKWMCSYCKFNEISCEGLEK